MYYVSPARFLSHFWGRGGIELIQRVLWFVIALQESLKADSHDIPVPDSFQTQDITAPDSFETKNITVPDILFQPVMMNTVFQIL